MKLSSLLEKIRSKSCITGSAESSVKKMKKLQVKYERFELMPKTYKLVRQKDGEASRFIDFYTENTILFKDICTKVEKRFFGTENCNCFFEVLHECVTSIIL